MMHESDGVAEALHETLGAAMTAAGALARSRAQASEDELRQARTESEQRERELRARLEADRAAARVELSTVNQPQWWERASPQEIEHAWETAVQWRDTDSDAARAAVRIRAEVEERYGIDPDQHPATKSQADSVSDQATAEERSGAPDVVPAGEAERDLEEGQELVAVSHAQSVAAAASGPSTPPRARRARGQGRRSVQRERGR
jgi:colicin import membrane protein